MEKWSSLRTVKQKCLDQWNQGKIISLLLESDNLFAPEIFTPDSPYKVKIAGPKAADIRKDFEKSMSFTQKWMIQNEVKVEFTVVSTKLMGHQKVPVNAVFCDIYDFIDFIGMRHEFDLIKAELTNMPQCLIDFIRRRPQSYLKYRSDFFRIQMIVSYLLNHPMPKIYLRELPIPSVDTKFLENHKGIIGEVLDFVLPPDFVNKEESRSAGFAKRYGFKDKPERIRFRILDPMIRFPLINNDCPDITLDSQSFANLDLDCKNVIVCENEVSFLALPNLPSCIGIFGSGYGFSPLKKADWLKKRKIVYWGDLDTHGFAILSEFRKAMAPCAVDSFFMDFNTLIKHKSFCVEEPKARNDELIMLTDEESLAYRALVDNKIGLELNLNHVRLEQELIPWNEVERELKKKISD